MDIQKILAQHALWIRDSSMGSRAILRGAILSGAILRGAILSWAILSGATLRGADLSGADLSGANLSGANLSGALLRGALLSGANLSGANLSGANLSGALLSEAKLGGANLWETRGCVDAGQGRKGWRFVGVKHDAGWMLAAGCRWFTMDEAREHCKNSPDALRRIELIALSEG